MRVGLLFLLFAFALAACGNDESPSVAAPSDAQLLERAKVAERNLTRMRDAIVAYKQMYGRVPDSVDDLVENGFELEPSDDYAELGYTFIHISFAEDGSLQSAWLIADPRANSGALRLRMNGVSNTFEYLPQGEVWGPARESE